MNRTVIFLLLLVACTARAQQPAPPFQDFEVQQPAEPKGGFPALNQFMAVNIRKPFMAQVANKKGMVILRGVVEPDGRIAEVTVARSLRPDCDREAVRAFLLFNAWKPAQKDGKAVRQVITFPVQYGLNEPVYYENGVLTRYYDPAFSPVASPDSAVLRSEMPADTFGIPTGNLVFFKKNGKKWKKETEMELVRTPLKNRQPTAGSLFTVGHRDEGGQPFGQRYTVDSQGGIYDEQRYGLDRELILDIDRDNNRLVTQRKVPGDNLFMVTSWYGNGQIQQIRIQPRFRMSAQPQTQVREQMLAYWDSTGIQLVNEGNGQVTLNAQTRSLSDTSRYTTLTEQGLYQKGQKQGRWTGKHADGSYWYDEQYNNGTLETGRAIYAGKTDTLRYSVAEQQPEFVGGMSGLNQLLAQNIRYPIDAHRARAQGRVFVSFVVCQDGSLCDYTVLKSVHPALDAEALRVVKLMNGKWKPGIQRGRPVRVKYNLPINFAIN